ncbi:ExbD/TolR family protein [Urechidicola croceus]|uniref:Biopolymer transporter ExbD n=1 Tax=Urechidicola croceus TaxID=1850246 RepID=A0A1D8PA55_9FLAO|nr:biopolymer transporter ExbD [Urechidicola croceus]AOW21452.1 biopolymer transporter ExbD [Urechidicola croceus]
MARRDTPEINAGSMADIAFLLLIFFLVTTTMDVDAGISRRLPEKQPIDAPPPPVIKMKNVFEVIINRNDELLIEGEYHEIKDIKQMAIDFIDNGGGKGNPMPNEVDGKECTWCKGAKDEASSDHPNKAVISLKSDRSTSYGTFIKVQNELGKAYTTLRNRLAKELYGTTYTEMVDDLSKDKGNATLKDKIDKIKSMYPEIISEAETN